MPYLIIRTDVRSISDQFESVAAHNGRWRDERHAPETRRQTATAADRDAAMHMARALAACGQVRNGRQRIKVIRTD